MNELLEQLQMKMPDKEIMSNQQLESKVSFISVQFLIKWEFSS